MAVDYFLKIEGIQGESADIKHKGEIQLESFSWGETNLGTASAGGGAGAGKVQVEDLHVTTRVNKASPVLFLACATGEHFKQAILTARKAGKDQQEYLIIKMVDLVVSAYHTGASADQPIDQIGFDFAQIHFEYRPQNPDGSLGTPVKAGWDVKQNKKL